MRIYDLAIVPSLIYYYVTYADNNNREDKLVQYVAETMNCLDQVKITKRNFIPSELTRYRRIRRFYDD